MENDGETKKEPNMNEEKPHDKKNLDDVKDTISLKIIAKNELFEIEIKEKTLKTNIAKNIDDIIHEISKSKSFTPQIIQKISSDPSPNKQIDDTIENPVKLLAMKLDIDTEKFENLKIIGVKGEAIQILKPTKLKPSESCYLLIAANEYVLGKPSIPYDELKELCELNSIRSKTPFYQLIDNAKRYGHIDKKKYDNSREVVLQSKGLDLLRSALNKAMNN